MLSTLKSIRFRDKTQSKRNRCVAAFRKGGGNELDKEHRQNTDGKKETDRTHDPFDGNKVNFLSGMYISK